jgi:hypothetical protein
MPHQAGAIPFIVEDGDVKLLMVTYYPMFVTKQTKEWPEKKLRNRQWVPLDEIDHHLKKGNLRKVVKTFRVLLPFIRAGAVKSKWTKGW